MKRVVVESPYAGDIDRNILYLYQALQDCLQRGEAPFASHAIYPGPLRDEVPEERALGLRAGEAWRAAAEVTVVYADHGISEGMQQGIKAATQLGQEIIYRKLFEEEDRKEKESTFENEWLSNSNLVVWRVYESSGFTIYECPRCAFPFHSKPPAHCYRCAWQPTLPQFG